MIGKIIAFFMKKNVKKIVLGAIVVVAGLIMLKKYMDSKKSVSVVDQGVVEEVVAPVAVMAPPAVAVVDPEVAIEQDPVKDMGQSPMAMPDDSQYGLV